MSEFRNLYYLYRVFRISPSAAFHKTVRKLKEKLSGKVAFVPFPDSEFKDFLVDDSFELNQLFSIPDYYLLLNHKKEILFYSEKVINHEFNLLGSGWVKVNYDIMPGGFGEYIYHPAEKFVSRDEWLSQNINSVNLNYSKKLNNMIFGRYDFIDWQIDFKSGFRWNAKQNSKNLKYGDVPGADIKLPWELGRMQHLAVLAMVTAMIKEGEAFRDKDDYVIEFQNQVLDFISSNPCGCGTQWMNSMDVGIRAVNLIIAYQFFNSLKVKFPKDFKFIFMKSLVEHADFISKNLEWSDGIRGNHYLANIVSLLCIALALPDSEKVNRWLAFCIGELEKEIAYQFNNDGCNFEASTAYHFFASEMVALAITLLLSVPANRFSRLKLNDREFKLGPRKVKIQDLFTSGCFQLKESKLSLCEQFILKIQNMSTFCNYLLKPAGEIDLIGDNDSGRFVKLLHKKIELRNLLTDRYYISVSSILEKLLKYITSESIASLSTSIIFEGFLELTYPSIIKDGHKSFENFGMYYLKNKLFRVAVRCGDIGQKGKGGHSHNDQLAIYLDYRNNDILVDAGTYCYTPHAGYRNKFRSTQFHNTLYFGKEQNDWFEDDKDDLFWLKSDKTWSKCTSFTNDYFEGYHKGFGKKFIRKIHLAENGIEIEDSYPDKRLKYINFVLSPKVSPNMIDDSSVELILENYKLVLKTDNCKIEKEPILISPEYGMAVLTTKLLAISNNSMIKWEIKEA